MYGEAQKVLGKGLSPFTRWLLGIVTGLFGVMLVLIAPEMTRPFAIYAFGGFFCLTITVMCVTTGKVRNILGRLIGFFVFLLSAFLFIYELLEGKLISGNKSEPSVLNAILFFFAFGLPGIWFAVKGKFPITPHE
ncbi:MAG: hypothetical protein KZQ84_13025 [Candidatus Thiodiazotropha sp. (ex Lucinoma borealis)]|nr:hypothetical protein [Candidatus Thiodiazotropha sp. (ex Lucinoma borealis)]